MGGPGGPEGSGAGGSEQGVGPRWSLWRAAYAYAEVIRDLSMSVHEPQGKPTQLLDVPTMLLTFALADYADREGIRVTRPADLGDLSGMQLWHRLATGWLMAAVSRVSPTSRAVMPCEGEPFYDLFHRMKSEVDAADPSTAGTGERAWYERGEDAQGLLALTLVNYVSPAEREAGVIPLRFLADKAEGVAGAPEPTRNRGAARPKSSEYMAPDQPLPPQGTAQWAARIMQGVLAGRLFLSHYLCSIQDRHLNLPDSLAAPRDPGESADDYLKRKELARQYLELHLLTADYAPDVANELMHIRPSDAPAAVEAITKIAQQWWTAANYGGTADDLLPAMTALLDGLVAPERHGEVQRLLEVITRGGGAALDRVRLRIMGAAAVDSKFEALHLAAAFAGALFQTCVPDQTAEFLRLTEDSMNLAEGRFDKFGTGSAAPARPTPPAPAADTRKKKARKASRKARRQGRG